MKKHVKHFENIYVILLISLLTFLFGLNSPLNPLEINLAGVDSSVFKTVSLMMRQGYMPYKDSFDHKGPLIYIINYLGDTISPYRGVWILEFGSIFITFFFMFRTARLLCDVIPSLLVMLTASSPLFIYFEGGNLTEEYAMPCIAISLYYFLKYYITCSVQIREVFLCGLLMGGVVLLRPNMITVWVVFCLAIFLENVYKKEWRLLGKYILFFGAGVFLILLPTVFWLFINDALKDFWNAYVVFNSKYCSGNAFSDDNISVLMQKVSSYLHFFVSPLYIVNFILCFFAYFKEKKLVRIYVAYLLMIPLFICLSGCNYGHYGMVIIPALSFPLAMTFNAISRIEMPSVSRILNMLFGLFLVVAFVFPSWSGLICSLPERYITRNQDKRDDRDEVLIADYIVRNTDENDSISVYGNLCNIYVLANRKHSTKYSYQFPIGSYDTFILDDYFNQLKEELPPIIVVRSMYHDDRIDEFLNNNGYELSYYTGTYDPKGTNVYSIQ